MSETNNNVSLLANDGISTAALTPVDKMYSHIPATMASGLLNDYVYADIRVVITPNSSNDAYNVDIYTRLTSTVGAEWRGQGNLYVTVTWNGGSYSNSMETTTPLYGAETSPWNGPLSFTGISAKGVNSLTFNIDVNLLRTSCIYCKVGGTGVGSKWGAGYAPGYDHDHYQHFYLNETIDVSSIPLVVAPTIGSFENTIKYNNQAGVSASTNNISFKWVKTAGGDIVRSEFRYKKSSDSSYSGWSNTATATTHNMTSLTAGTTYDIQVRSYNAAGYSNILSGTIRTRHNAPVTTLTLESRDLEALTFKWTSDKSLEYTYYKIGEGNWISLKQTGISNTFQIDGLNPKTAYTISFYGTSYAAHDALHSSNKSASGTTYDIAHITNISDCIFGATTNVVIASESNKTLKLKVQTTGNSNTALFETELAKGTYIFNPPQDILDKMYKCYSNANTVPITFQIITKGTKDWEDTVQTKSLALTGIVKTARIGINDSPRRANGFIGVNETARRAVFWIGDSDNKPRRCT